MERSCDEEALKLIGEGSKKAYAQALLNISVKKSPLGGARLLSFGDNSVKARIKNILREHRQGIAATGAAVVVLCAACACLLTDKKQDSIFKAETDTAFIGIDSITKEHPVGICDTPADRDELVSLLDSLRFTAVSGCGEYPDEYTGISAELKKGESLVYRISMLSPVCTMDKGLFGSNAQLFGGQTVYGRYITVESYDGDNSTAAHYELSEADYEKLTAFLCDEALVFPEGKYIQKEGMFSAVVKDGAEGKEIYLIGTGDGQIMPFAVRSYAHGMLLVTGSSGENIPESAVFFECTGKGRFRVRTGALSSLMVPGEFEYDADSRISDPINGTGDTVRITDRLLYDFLRRYENYSDLYALGAVKVYADPPHFYIGENGKMSALGDLWAQFASGAGKMVPLYYDNTEEKWHRSEEMRDVSAVNTTGRELPRHSFETEAKLSFISYVQTMGYGEGYSLLADPITGEMQPVTDIYISSEPVIKESRTVNAYAQVIAESADLVHISSIAYEPLSYEFAEERMVWRAPRGTGEPVHRRDGFVYDVSGMRRISIQSEDTELCREFGAAFLGKVYGQGDFVPENYISDEGALEVARASAEQRAFLYQISSFTAEYRGVTYKRVIPVKADTERTAFVMDFDAVISRGKEETVLESCRFYFETEGESGNKRIARFYELSGKAGEYLEMAGGDRSVYDFSQVDDALLAGYLRNTEDRHLSRRLIKGEKTEALHIRMRTENEDEQGLTLFISQTGEERLTTGSYFFLQYMDGTGRWTNMRKLPDAPHTTPADDETAIPAGGEISMDTDWRDIYGTLDKGLRYRIGKQISVGDGKAVYNCYYEFDL